MFDGAVFATLVSAIYEAGADDSLWPEVLRAISNACASHATVLTLQSASRSELSCLAPQCDPTYYQSYGSHYHSVDPIWRRAVSAPAGTVWTDCMIMPKGEFIRTEFYNDFLVPQRLGSQLNAIAVVEHGRKCVIATHRRRKFEPQHLQLFQILSPHLQRAMQFNAKLANLNGKCMASAEALNRLEQGALLVDVKCGVMFANEQAERQFAAGALRIVDAVLEAGSPAATAQLHALVAGCARPGAGMGGTVALSRKHANTSLSLHVLPLRASTGSFFQADRPGAVIFVTGADRKPDLAASQIRHEFGLTAAEMALANEIVSGDGLQATADRLKITRATARTHLAHIFSKTGTRRQAELVNLLLLRHRQAPSLKQ